jgi:hypothetical protein
LGSTSQSLKRQVLSKQKLKQELMRSNALTQGDAAAQVRHLVGLSKN